MMISKYQGVLAIESEHEVFNHSGGVPGSPKLSPNPCHSWLWWSFWSTATLKTHGPLASKLGGYIGNTVDGRIIQTLIHRATPLTPNINVIFLFGSFPRMDEINQTPRAGTALRNHNIEIRGR